MMLTIIIIILTITTATIIIIIITTIIIIKSIFKDIQLLDVSVDVLIDNLKAVESAEKIRTALLASSKPIEIDSGKKINSEAEISTTTSGDRDANEDWDDSLN